MKKSGVIIGIAVMALILFSAGFAQQHRSDAEFPAPDFVWQENQNSGGNSHTFPDGIISAVFVENSDGTDDGMQRLIRSMQNYGISFHQTQDMPYGLIASDDVVLLKINAQWDQTGGTNTDLIRSVIQEILNHPSGFTGEIIVADNGQAHSAAAISGNRGSLNWPRSNAADQTQTTMSVIRSFQATGVRISGMVWDDFSRTRVQEFSTGDMRNGFVVRDGVRSTGITVSYPKFTTEFGTHISFREGIWNATSRTYNSERLKIINMPVLKSHWTFQATAAVKNYMGVPCNWLPPMSGRPHNSVGTGGMGTLMVETRIPILNILDMIWVTPEGGPRSSFSAAVRINKIAASTDAFALDYWGVRHVLMPEAARVPGGRASAMNPAGTEPGTFGHWMRLSMNELHRVGIPATMNPAEMLIVQNGIVH